MARRPFTTWRPISGSCGPNLVGLFKVVHHTKEGSSTEGAMNNFRSNRSDPHFTVSATNIFQHIKRRAHALRAAALAPAYDAQVGVGSRMSFVEGLSEQGKNNVLYSIQLAQRWASGAYDRFTQTQF